MDPREGEGTDDVLQPGRQTSDSVARATGVFSFDVVVPATHRYQVLYRSGLLDEYGTFIVERFGRRTYVIVTDDRVHGLYGTRLERSFHRVGIEPVVLVIPEGESSKSLSTFAHLIERMAEIGVDRRAVVVNFGGGVVSDLGGFVAASYMRGIDYVNFATSLLGQLDAAVGGKVAVNAREAKNLIGAFHHPRNVAGDTGLFGTLSARDYRSGLAEAIKVGIIASPELFERFEVDAARLSVRDEAALIDVIGTAARVKMELIARDPYELDLRRPLNFGHTIGHPIETEFGYRKIRHGEAVAIGMGVATCLSLRKGSIDRAIADRIFAVLHRFGLLGFSEPIRAESVIGHVRYVRLVRGHQLHFVLPTAIGAVEITDDVTNDDLINGFSDYDDEVQARFR